jgi:hypothetical protein
MGRENDGYIERQKMSGETAAAPVLPLDIILKTTDRRKENLRKKSIPEFHSI